MNFVFQNAFYCHVCHRNLCVISYRVYTSGKQIEEALICVFTSLRIVDLELKTEKKAALMPSPVQTRLQACLIFYQRVSLCILWLTV